MTDLDNTQIITADDSFVQNSSTIESEALLKIVSGTDPNTYQIGKETIIGRANPSDLIISAPSLSKQHAKITFNNGQYFITDLGSSNKTYHNKVQLQPNVCYALRDGDEIKLGDIICLFQEQQQSQTNKNMLSEPIYETYIPPINTLVEEDSPWPVDDDIPPLVITETNVDVIPSTQTITDSYDDQEPTQPMKIWNGNSNNTNGLTRTSIKNSDDETLKQNGLNESSSRKSSSFIPSTLSSILNNDNEDDDSLVIGATTLPATVPIVIESTQINNDDQIEIISSLRTEKFIEDDNNQITIETTTTTTEIDKTQAYTLKSANEEISSNEQIINETQLYELKNEQIITDVVETKREEVHQLVMDGDKIIEEIITTTTTTTTTETISENDNLPMETQVYDLQPINEETTTNIKNIPVETQVGDLQPTNEETSKTSTVEDNNPPVETLAYDLQSTNEETTINIKNISVETQVYNLQPINEETPKTSTVENNNPPVETLAYDLQPTNEETTTNIKNIPVETQVYDLQPTNEETTKTSTADDDNLPMETQVYDLEPTNDETTKASTIETKNLPMETLAYDLQPTNEETTTVHTEDENLPTETEAYNLQLTNEETTKTTTIEDNNPPMETIQSSSNEQIDLDATAPALCTDTQQYDLDEQIDDSSPRPASEECEVVPMSKLAEQLQNVENIVDDTTPKQHIEVTINQNLVEKNTEDERMDTNQTEPSSTSINDEPIITTTTDTKPETTIDEQQESVNQKKDEIISTTDTSVVPINETDKTDTKVQPTIMEQEKTSNTSLTTTPIESIATSTSEDVPSSTLDTTNKQQEIEEDAEDEGEETEEAAPVSGRNQRGIPRRAARRARGRRGGATRARVVSTRIHGGRRNVTVPPTIDNQNNNTTLEETVNTETDESPQKLNDTQPISPTPAEETSSPNQTNTNSNIRVSARIKARASSGRNRPFPYTDDYVDLDDLEKQSKIPTTPTTTGRRSTRGGRSLSASQKRISLRQQPIDTSESPDEKTKKQKDNTTDIYEQMDTGGENEEPILSTKTVGRKRKSTTPVVASTTKRTRSTTTPQAVPATNTRRKQSSTAEQSSPPNPITPRRGRRSTKLTTPTEQSSEEQTSIHDRPVRIALSSHLNFDQNHLDTLRKLGFEIMDESCQVDALVVDRIRRTKKFFMCLARGAHILSPTWIETMIKENRYIPYDKYYLEDTNAETRYGFQLRESVRLAKQHPIFENYKIFCTKDTSPPYDDLKDIIEAAGGKFIEKINLNKPGKDLVCIVAQVHKNEYEDLCKKGVPIVSEEFALSGISKQKLDFEAFSLFQNVATTVKPTGSK